MNRCCCSATSRLCHRESSAKRRFAFLEWLALVALWAGPWSSSSASLPDIFSYRANDLVALRKGFAQPPREAGPWVYWFWWNNVLSREEIERELVEMATAGIVGAELRVVTFHGWGGEPLSDMDSANLERLGHRQLRYLSDEWVDTLAFTCGGRLVTKPLTFTGSRLQLNIDTDAAGYAQVGFVDERGQPIPGYSVQDCVYVNGDAVDYEVEWLEKGKDVSSLAGKTVQLVFELHGAKLFALQFQQGLNTSAATPSPSASGTK
jgi:hypothetical protein